MEEYIHLFLTSALRRDKSASRPDSFTPEKKGPVYRIGVWDGLEKKN